METMQRHHSDLNQQRNINDEFPIKHFALNNVPLYHAYYHQHMHVNNETHNSLRKQSSIQKRAPNDEKQISKNITMVLEDLLK